jgi:hypothetical protein
VSSYQDPHNPSQSQLRSFSGAQFLDLLGQESHLVAILSFQVLRRIFRRGYVLTYWNVFQHAAKHVSIPSRRVKVLLWNENVRPLSSDQFFCCQNRYFEQLPCLIKTENQNCFDESHDVFRDYFFLSFASRLLNLITSKVWESFKE